MKLCADLPFHLFFIMCQIVNTNTYKEQEEKLIDKEVYNADRLMQAYKEIRKSVSFKYSVQLYGINLLDNVSKTIDNHLSGNTAYHKGVEFTISERGKIRHITPVPFAERVLTHCLCHNVLVPTLRPKLIYDNCASLTHRGIDMQRDRLQRHLHEYYNTYHTNKGWILISDFSKYFDNIDHKKFIEAIKPYFPQDIIDEVQKILDVYRIDGSVMTDEEFEYNKTHAYDSKLYYHRKQKIAEERYIDKSVGIGSELSQIAGVFYPTPLDNYVKIVKGYKLYGRYNDDFYCIRKDKQDLIDLLEVIKKICKELNITLNEKKTRIIRLDRPFVFLKVRYTLTDTGKVIRSFLSKTFVREKRRFNKFRHQLDIGVFGFDTVLNQYKSWRGNVARKVHKSSKSHGKTMYANHKSIRSLDKYFKQLFWKELKENNIKLDF